MSFQSFYADYLGDAVRFLDLIKPFTPLLPEVASPETKVPFNQKLMWTGVSFNPRWLERSFSPEFPEEMADLKFSPVDSFDFFGHEPNATIWHCLLRHFRPLILAANDVSE